MNDAKSHGAKSHGSQLPMISTACGAKRLIKYQLPDYHPLRGTGPFGAIDLRSASRAAGFIPTPHDRPASPPENRLPRKRPHPPIQGYAGAHRSRFEQIGLTATIKGALGLWRAAYSVVPGVGGWTGFASAGVLAVWRVGV
jgi:hypothetical protein